MDIVVTGRHIVISDRFREHITNKLSKVEQLAPRAQRLDVQITHEKNPRLAGNSDRVEITVLDKGPVIRAEAAASDKYGALDLAYAKLLERLRRSKDRRKVHHGRHRPPTVNEAVGVTADGGGPGLTAVADEPEPDVDEYDDGQYSPADAEGDCPVLIREKEFPANPITLDEALTRMELVGHDFYLFLDSESSKPSVVYRRKGWSYGVITLGEEGEELDGERVG